MARPWAPDRRWLCDDPIADTAEAGRLGRADPRLPHHAFELTPTSTEVDHLIGLVQTLAVAR